MTEHGEGLQRVDHGFGPLYDHASRILFLGTMASPASRRHGFFYMHPRNRFWPVYGSVVRRSGRPHRPRGPLGAIQACLRVAPPHRVMGRDRIVRHSQCQRREHPQCGAERSGTHHQWLPDQPHLHVRGESHRTVYHRYCEPNLAEQGITLPATALPSTSPAYAAATLGDLITAYRARIDWNAYRTPVVDGVGRRPTHRI